MNKASAAETFMDPRCKIVSTKKSSKCMRIINIWNLSSLKIQIITNGLTATGDDTEGFAPSLLANNGPIELTESSTRNVLHTFGGIPFSFRILFPAGFLHRGI